MPRLRLSGTVLVLLLLVFVFLGLMRFTGLERDALSPPEIWLRDLLAPLQSGVSIVGDVVSGAYNRISGYGELKQENQLLREELKKLRLLNNELQEEHLQNARLQRLLGLKLKLEEDFSLLPARIISRGISSWYQTLVIDAGSEDGVLKDMTVMVADGLVGRVIATSRQTSEVLTILDREGAAGAMLQLSRFPGVVDGTNGVVQKLQLIHLPHDAPVMEGEAVITSGLDDIFPKGIRIGYIKDVQTEPNGLMKKATVIPFVDFRRLEEVFIITEIKRGGDDAGLDFDSDISGDSAAADDGVSPAPPGE